MLTRRQERRLRRLVIFWMAALVLNVCLPTPIRPQPAEAKTVLPSTSYQRVDSPAPTPIALPAVPNKPRTETKRRLVLRSSAYSSTVDQTDGDPWTTASGAKVHPGTVAANCLPFGTKIRLPDAFGDRVFTVEDRMNAKWGCGKIDIWMPTRDAALQWGVRRVQIEILT